MNINKSAILLAAAFIAVAAVSVRSQQTWQEKAREISAKQSTVIPVKPVHAAVILGLKETLRLVTDSDGSYYETSGWVVRYATVSSNGPAIPEGMNGADAIATITATGLKSIFSDSGLHVFSGEINQ